jgi:hypothetical protein
LRRHAWDDEDRRFINRCHKLSIKGARSLMRMRSLWDETVQSHGMILSAVFDFNHAARRSQEPWREFFVRPQTETRLQNPRVLSPPPSRGFCRVRTRSGIVSHLQGHTKRQPAGINVHCVRRVRWAVLADARPEAQIAMARLHDLLGDLHFSAAFRCPSRKCHLGRNRSGNDWPFCEFAVCAGPAILCQALASLCVENSSTSTAPPGGGRPRASCFGQRPAAILVLRRLVQGDRKGVDEST